MSNHAFSLLRNAFRDSLGVVHRHPFTAVLMVAVLVTSGIYGTLSGDLHDTSMSFGLPALREGHWWTYLVGALIVPRAALLPVAIALVALSVGPLERRVGWRRTSGVLLGTHLVGTVGASLLLWVASSDAQWRWADGVARLSDTGLSAGALGVLAVLTAFLLPPTRRAVRVGVGAYLVVTLVRSGLLWDVEHLLAFGAGLLVGPSVAGRRRTPLRGWGSSMTDVRNGAALLLAATAVTELVEVWFPGYGGLFGAGPVVDPSSPRLATALGFLVTGLLVADGLRRGRPLAWRTLLTVSSSLLALQVLGVVTLSTGSVLVAATLLALAIWHHGMVRSQPTRKGADVTDLEARIANHGGGSLGWQHTWSGSQTWATGDGVVAVTYRSSSGVAIVVGDPVGPRTRWADAVEEFREFCEGEGLVPAWYAVGDDLVTESGPGWSSLQIGEDTVLSLPGLEFRGRSWQDVRTARNRAAKEGIVMESLHLGDASPALLAQVREISEVWVEEKPLPEMGFTLGGLAEALDPVVRTHVAVDTDGRVHGVTTWMPVHRDGRVVGWTLDLMRRRSDGFRPVMEFLIAESAMLFQEEGFESMSLSVAPLARRTAGREGALDRALESASRVLEPTYGFRSLLGFKAKFDPSFRPVHLVYASRLDLPLISLAIGRAYLPDLSLGQLGHLVGEIGRPIVTRAAQGLTPAQPGLEARPQPVASAAREPVLTRAA